MACDKCSRINSLKEHGYLYFQSSSVQLLSSLAEKLKTLNRNVKIQPMSVKFQYESISSLQSVLQDIDELFNEEAKKAIYGKWESSDIEIDPFPAPFISFTELYERSKNPNYLTIINNALFSSYIQPIVKLKDNTTFGYEFLLRPKDELYPFSPGDLFTYAQKAGLQSLLDSQARISSIKIGADMLPKGIKRFINFLPSSIYDPNHCLRSTFLAVEKYNVDPNDLVFEVVETEKIKDMVHLKEILSVYKKNGMKVALDDLGSGYSTLQVLKELQPHYAKIDRGMIDRCDLVIEKQKALIEIVKIANDHGIVLLAEGIERKEEVDFCLSIHIPLAQGYYFSPPRPRP